MEYAICYIVRFEGTLTQGPNKGKAYILATSWGGVQFDTIEQARAAVAKYHALEPRLTIHVYSRQYVQTGRKGKFVETLID